MKKSLFIFIASAVFFISCDDFLDRKPLAMVSSTSYLWAEDDLAAYAANHYSLLPSHSGWDIGTFAIDNNSDNQVSSTPNPLFVTGQTRVGDSGGAWDFSNIRSINYFITTVVPRIEKGEITGDEKKIKHYLGEMYFFRAYEYFNKLVQLGDFPIIMTLVGDSYNEIREASMRRPRNEVARFIIGDLDKAYELMLDNPPMTNRLTKDCAALMKSRVALFEGTWEKYHKGTARVPGGPGWPGKSKDYLQNFSVDIDKEIQYFLTQAKESAKIVSDKHSLASDYEKIFNSFDLSGNNEVLLWRKYSTGTTVPVYHHVSGYIQRNGGSNAGYTRSMVESFLMKNGLPIYAVNSGYKGDVTYADIFNERDPRLNFVMINQYDKIQDEATFSEYIVKGVGYYYRAPIFEPNVENKCPTGYSIKKGLNTLPSEAPTKENITACVIFRAAEAYLNYIEANYELDGLLDNNSDKYWKALRSRAGMDIDYGKTISNTELSKEIDLARYSGSSLISPILYNIRRERRIELAAEGLRLNDLKRWRALDMMENYHVEGFNFWDEMYKLYTDPTPNPPSDFPLTTYILMEQGKATNPNISAKIDGKYLMPFRINPNNIAFNGYNWNQNKYLSPIATTHFRLTTEIEGSNDYSTSSIYQNPGWSTEAGSLPDGD